MGKDIVCESFTPAGLFRSGLVDADRSWGGRGETGTFHKCASSGKSSSESWYSSSNSLIVLRLGCQEPLLLGRPFLELGDSPDRGCGVPLGNDDVAIPGIADGCEGDGERERYRFLEESESDGVDGLVNPLFVPTPLGRVNGSVVWCINAPLI